RTRRRNAGASHPIAETVRFEGFGIFLFLVIVPVAVYMASFARQFADTHVSFAAWWSLQRKMAGYSLRFNVGSTYASRAWTWVLLKRPVTFFHQRVDAKT